MHGDAQVWQTRSFPGCAHCGILKAVVHFVCLCVLDFHVCVCFWTRVLGARCPCAVSCTCGIINVRARSTSLDLVWLFLPLGFIVYCVLTLIVSSEMIESRLFPFVQYFVLPQMCCCGIWDRRTPRPPLSAAEATRSDNKLHPWCVCICVFS